MKMLRLILVCGLLALGMAIGCRPAVQVVPDGENPTFGPKGGPVVALPGDQGFAEVALEPVGGGIRLVAYFYATAELGSPLAPSPADVRIDLEQPGGGSQAASLSPDSRPGESRFASTAGDYEIDPLIGTLHATLNGQPISAFFSGAIR